MSKRFKTNQDLRNWLNMKEELLYPDKYSNPWNICSYFMSDNEIIRELLNEGYTDLDRLLESNEPYEIAGHTNVDHTESIIKVIVKLPSGLEVHFNNYEDFKIQLKEWIIQDSEYTSALKQIGSMVNDLKANDCDCAGYMYISKLIIILCHEVISILKH